MYRHLLPLLLCQAVAPAPQALSDTDITYVKLQPAIEAPTPPTHYRESRIEHLPLTIPGNVTLEGLDRIVTELETKEVYSSNLAERTALPSTALPDSSDIILAESSNLSERTALPSAALPESESEILPATIEPNDLTQQTDASEEIALPERTLDINTEETDQPEQSLPERTELAQGDELLEAHGSDLSDTLPSETYISERRGKTFESSETTDIFDEPTERYEDITQIPEVAVSRTRPTPKFVPKLSYFQKPEAFVSFPTNSLEKSAKRRFRSHCRCEKIWNCPKLQISVPRCPNEYFLCCF